MDRVHRRLRAAQWGSMPTDDLQSNYPEPLASRIAALSPEQRKLFELQLKHTRPSSSASSITAIPRMAEDQLFPLSFAQERLWFLNQLQPNDPIYNVRSAISLTGSLDPTALEHALREVVRRHEVLRTTFTVVDGEPRQRVWSTMPLDLPIIELPRIDPSERLVEVLQRASLEWQIPFDLERGPLYRASLLRLAEEEHVLLLTLHHIVCDGWSIRTLMQEVASLYVAALTGKTAALPALPIQYVDFAVWQRQRLQGALLQTQLDYWQQQLAGLTELSLPTDHPQRSAQVGYGERYIFAIHESVFEALRGLGRQEGVTLFMILLLSFQTLLHRYSGQDDIAVGVTIANRHRLETEQLIGFFVNVLVLRADLSGNPVFRAALQQVREATLQGYAHQDLPFDRMIQMLRPDRSASHVPLIRAGFDFQKDSRQLLQLPGVTLDFLEIAGGRPQFDITLRIVEDGQRLTCLLDYNRDLFERPTIVGMATHFSILLEQIAQQPEWRVLDIPLDSTLASAGSDAPPAPQPAGDDLFSFEDEA